MDKKPGGCRANYKQAVAEYVRGVARQEIRG